MGRDRQNTSANTRTHAVWCTHHVPQPLEAAAAGDPGFCTRTSRTSWGVELETSDGTLDGTTAVFVYGLETDIHGLSLSQAQELADALYAAVRVARDDGAHHVAI